MAPDKKRILIIEDNKDLILLLSEVFKKEGMDVSVAVDGEKGLILSLEEKPDMILLDIILPKMDGITMLKKLREDKEGKNIPVIVLSNLSSAEDLSEAMEIGVYDYLVKKDWELEDIVAKVKKTLGI